MSSSSSLLGMLTDQLGPEALEQISKHVGADQKSTNRAVAGALPALLGAMTKNASSTDGAASLLGALTRDHDGGILDSVGDFLGAPDEKAGNGILGHLLGSDRNDVESALGATSGLDKAQMGKILAMLAPMIMGALGKQQRERKLDEGGLGELLRGEQSKAGAGGGIGGVLGSMLDADGDGSFIDDIAEKAGSSLLGSLFGKK